MRAVFDKDGYLSQWMLEDNLGRIPDENEQVIPTPEIEDINAFYNEFHLYHLIDGKLVKDDNRKAELEEATKREKRTLTIQEKLELFAEAFDVDEQPEYKNGLEFEPYFDKDRMKFSWKQVVDK